MQRIPVFQCVFGFVSQGKTCLTFTQSQSHETFPTQWPLGDSWQRHTLPPFGLSGPAPRQKPCRTLETRFEEGDSGSWTHGMSTSFLSADFPFHGMKLSWKKTKQKLWIQLDTVSRQEWDGLWKRNVKGPKSLSWCSKKWNLRFLAGSEVGGHLCSQQLSFPGRRWALRSSRSGA